MLRETKREKSLSDAEVVVAFTSKKRLSEMFSLYMLNPAIREIPNEKQPTWVFVRDNIGIDVQCDECRGALYDKDSGEWHKHDDDDDDDFCGGCHNEGVDCGGAYHDVYYARLSLNGVKWHEYEEVVSDMLELCDKLQDPDNPQAYAYKIMLDDMLGKVDVKCNANNEESSIYNAPYLKEFVNDLLVTEERIRTNDEGEVISSIKSLGFLKDIEKGEE